MSKNTLTAADAKKIISQVWKDNDYPIDIILDNANRHFDSVVEFLNVKFYTYAVRRGSGIYALVEAIKPDDALINPQLDYAIKNIKITFALPAAKADVLENFTQKLRTKHLGKHQDFSVIGKGISGYLAFDVLSYDKQPNPQNIDLPIVCSMDLKISYTSNVALAGQKVWKLDGVELPYIQEGVDLEKSGNTNDVYGDKSSQTLPTRQTKYFRFTLPFATDNAACVALQKEILDGDMQQIHTLTYHDGGLTYPESQPFTAKVTLFSTARSSAQVAGKSDFDIIFTPANDESKSKVQYEMALIDNHFDMSSVNTRWFASQAEQQAWFAAKIAASPAPYKPIKAPNISSLFISNQTYFAPSDVSLDSLLSKNYAIIRATEGEQTRYYYYYVQSASVGADNQILLSLKMDTIQTYMFLNEVDAIGLIKRAHINRWKKGDDNLYYFNTSPESPFFEREYVQNLSKRITRSQKVIQKYDTTPKSEFNMFLDDNVLCWVQIYLAEGENGHNFLEMGTGNIFSDKLPLFIRYQNISNYANQFDPPYHVLTYPIFKTTKNGLIPSIEFVDNLTNPTKTIKIDSRAWNGVYNAENRKYVGGFKGINGTGAVINVKITTTAPFYIQQYNRDGNTFRDSYKIVNSATGAPITLRCLADTITQPNTPFKNQYMVYGWQSIMPTVVDSTSDSYAFSYGLVAYNYYQNSNNLFSEVINTGIQYGFTVDEIKENSNATKLNPKLLSQDFCELQLSYVNSAFTYDPLKIGKSNISIVINEMLTPDITRLYARYYSDNDNQVYTKDTVYNYTGNMAMQDNCIPYSRNQLDILLANQPNYFLQQSGIAFADVLRGIKNVGTDLGLVGSTKVVSDKPFDDFEGIASQIGEIKNSLAIDNMRRSPESISNSSGNALFNLSINGLAIYIGIFECLEHEKKIANDIMLQQGFAYNRIGYIKGEGFDRIRKNWNFVQATIENIYGVSMSNEARGDIIQRFARGIRFWNGDEVRYDLQNYEIGL